MTATPKFPTQDHVECPSCSAQAIRCTRPGAGGTRTITIVLCGHCGYYSDDAPPLTLEMVRKAIEQSAANLQGQDQSDDDAEIRQGIALIERQASALRDALDAVDDEDLQSLGMSKQDASRLRMEVNSLIVGAMAALLKIDAEKARQTQPEPSAEDAPPWLQGYLDDDED